jgi:hypothetical protein
VSDDLDLQCISHALDLGLRVSSLIRRAVGSAAE